MLSTSNNYSICCIFQPVHVHLEISGLCSLQYQSDKRFVLQTRVIILFVVYLFIL